MSDFFFFLYGIIFVGFQSPPFLNPVLEEVHQFSTATSKARVQNFCGGVVSGFASGWLVAVHKPIVWGPHGLEPYGRMQRSQETAALATRVPSFLKTPESERAERENFFV